MSELVKTISTTAGKAETREAQPYWNPYLAGIGLGLVLLLSFLVMGRGLGASGAFGSLITTGIDAIAPEHVTNNAFFSEYHGDGTSSPMKDWLVFEVIGVVIGGFISGLLANRLKKTVEKGPNISVKGRLMFAVAGGAIMAMGAKLARGCTSGQALTGGALLNTGSWAFMMCVFIGGYAAAYFMRRQWR